MGVGTETHTMSCIICLDKSPLIPVKTECCTNSLYCQSCLEKWLHSTVTPSCPVCRQSVREVGDLRGPLMHKLHVALNCLYVVALTYEMYGLFLPDICHTSWNPVLLLFGALFSSAMYTLLLLPAWALVFGVWIVRPWPIWNRFQDMCITPPVSSYFNYGCHPMYRSLVWENNSEYVHYGHNVYHRAHECTRYIMPALLVVLQLLMAAVVHFRRRHLARRRFLYTKLPIVT